MKARRTSEPLIHRWPWLRRSVADCMMWCDLLGESMKKEQCKSDAAWHCAGRFCQTERRYRKLFHFAALCRAFLEEENKTFDQGAEQLASFALNGTKLVEPTTLD